VIDVYEVTVELDMQVSRCLDRGVGAYSRSRGVNAREDCAGREVNERDGASSKCSREMLYAHDALEVGLDPWWNRVGGTVLGAGL
jgi:hypothetical protein